MFLFLGVFRLLFGRLSPSASCSPVCFVCDDSPAVGCGGDTSVALISAAASNSLSGLAHVGRRGRHAPPSPLAWAARAWRRRGQAGDTLRPKLRSWGSFSDIPAFGVDRGRKRAGEEAGPGRGWSIDEGESCSDGMRAVWATWWPSSPD